MEQFEQRIDLQKLETSVQRIRDQFTKLIVGQKQLVDLLLTSILADGHVLLEGAPGVAKTLSAKVLAKSLATGFSRIQFTPDLMPSDVIGTSVFNQKDLSFEFKKGPVFSNIVLIDEVNRAPAKTQSALFEVMEEKQVTVDGVSHVLDNPFLIIATQNPIEQEGTYRLPEAQLDRFLMKVEVDYPNEDDELNILQIAQSGKAQLDQVEAILSESEIKELRAIVEQVKVDEKLLAYIAKIVSKTRNNKALFVGASPRASLALLKASKAFAALQGRDFVIPEDIIELTEPILKHRIGLSPEKEMEGVDEQQFIQQLVKSVEIPR